MPAADRPPPHDPRTATLPLWPLPLIAGLLPAVAALTAFALSVRLGLVPGCNPFVDGCVSVSRAARHDLPNHLFRAMVLPAATLQGLFWLLAARWLQAQAGAGRGLRALAPLGVAAAVALVLYATFLGTEGPIYRALRQYGTVVYFGFTCLCLLITGGAVQRLAVAGALPRNPRLERTMAALAIALVLLGLGNALAGVVVGGAMLDRIQNATEWWGAAILTLGFVALAATWRRCGLGVALRGG